MAAIVAVSTMAVAALANAGFASEPVAQNLEPIPQSQMSVVRADSEELTGEGSNGAAALILDGKKDTYWHTRWAGSIDPLPHHLVIKLADTPVSLARLVLTPRQSSNGSGRVHEWELRTSTDASCAPGSFPERAQYTGEFPGEWQEGAYASDRTIDIPQTVQATCVKLDYLSTWGGANGSEPISKPERVASLAEFNAYTGTPASIPPSESEESAPTSPTIHTIPENELLTLTDGELTVAMRTAFPQVVSWTRGEVTVPGNDGAALTRVRINETSRDVIVSEATITDGAHATWHITVPSLPGVSFDAKASVENGTWRLELANLQNPGPRVSRIEIPGLDLVTLNSTMERARIATATMSVDRSRSGDLFTDVARMRAETTRASWLAVPSTAQIAFGMENNAIIENTVPDANVYRAEGTNSKWVTTTRADEGDASIIHASISPGPFVWHSPNATVIGPDEDPWIEVRPTFDANDDATVDWQDGAIALRAIRPLSNGMNEVPKRVIARIPFNIVSQATHPFLRTLDDTKRISLATDNLGQQVLLKGYQAEGHDAAHPDYGGHYNERAGGLEDLKTLVDEGEKWNAMFGVHINATESYSEAHAFSEDLLKMPPKKAWGWMNQSYSINGPKDLGTGTVLERLEQFRREVPANLKWLYLDVYYPHGWEADRFGDEMRKRGWIVGSEWADRFPENNVWSHWANDEHYGGQSLKGINSQIWRFVENSRRDVWNPDPILSNTNIVEFEGWSGHNDYGPFIKNVWERNLPTKFLQLSDIMTWDKAAGRITFANGTEATSPLKSIGGTTVPTNRTITFDGATVYTRGTYLLPWTDGGTPRLYHWNPNGGDTQWTLTNAWRDQTTLTLFKLTDTGRVRVADLPVEGGKVTIPGAEAGVAYVLYPTADVPAPRMPNWGQGSRIQDPGFFSGTLDAYHTTGDVQVVTTARKNFQAQIGAGEGSLSQTLTVPAGTWNASAWIQIDPQSTRTVTLSVSGEGIAATQLQPVVDGIPTTTLTSTQAINATASDEKKGTYFQRARVTFTSTGAPVTLMIHVAEGQALVSVDDLRIVPFVSPTLPAGVEADTVVAFEDFEHPDAGYWPFVTGAGNIGGDARTQLAERHEPYSQKGWWGVDTSNRVVEGGKLIDNVLDGHWSLLAHEENNGLVLRTTTATMPLRARHAYRISFDYQSAFADKYQFVAGYDRAGRSITTTTDTLGEVRSTQRYSTELVVGSCGAYWWGFKKLAGGNQSDLSLDNILVEDLGVREDSPACADLTITPSRSLLAGMGTEVVTSAASTEPSDATDLVHELRAPEGWQVVLLSADSEMTAGGTATARWLVTPPADAASGELTHVLSYAVDGARAVGSTTRSLPVTKERMVNGENYLSDLPFASAPQNGWGPVERDRANGEQGEGDGPQISIDGVKYLKGIGAHALSRVSFDLDAKCTHFSAVVGVDDAQPSLGSVRFRVLGDDRRVLAGPTEVLRANSRAVTLEADITGVRTLTLVADNGGDGSGNDWASWGDAKVTCTVGSQGEVGVPTVVADESSVEAGDSVTLAVSGFMPYGGEATDFPKPVRLVNAATGEGIGVVPSVGEASTGSFTWTTPEGVSGEVEIAAVQEVEAGVHRTARTTVTVTEPEAGPVDPGNDPTVEAHTAVVEAGDPVTLAVSGFMPYGGEATSTESAIAEPGGDTDVRTVLRRARRSLEDLAKYPKPVRLIDADTNEEIGVVPSVAADGTASFVWHTPADRRGEVRITAIQEVGPGTVREAHTSVTLTAPVGPDVEPDMGPDVEPGAGPVGPGEPAASEPVRTVRPADEDARNGLAATGTDALAPSVLALGLMLVGAAALRVRRMKR